MTGKERFNLAIQCKTGDRMPVVTHHIMPSFLEKCTDYGTNEEFFDAAGIDKIKWFNSECYEQTDEWVETVTKLPDTKYATYKYSYKTPEGTLNMVLQSNEYTTWIAEHLIKNSNDIELLNYYPKCSADVKNINENAPKYHIFRSNIPCFRNFGQPGCWQDAACMVGIENLIIKTFDDPKWVHKLLEILCEQKTQYIKSLVGAKFDIIELGGGDASSTVISPDIFENFVAPYDSRLIEEAHKVGQKIVYHTCGGMMPILENILSMKPDAMETFTPIDMGGDTDLARAKKIINGRACMIGGFDQGHFFKGCTMEDTRREVRRCFAAAGGNGGFVLAPSDHFFDANMDLIKAFADEASKCTY